MSKFARICEKASVDWLLRQLKGSVVKWLSIYPEGMLEMAEWEREAYGTNDLALIKELEKRIRAYQQLIEEMDGNLTSTANG